MAVDFFPGWRLSHWTRRGLQWARETTHSFRSWKNSWAEGTISRKLRVLASTSSVAFKVTCAARTFFSSDTQLRSSHKCFSHCRQPLQSASVCTYLSAVCSSKYKSASISLSRPSDVRSAPSTREYCSDRYATVLLLRSWDGRPYVAHEVRVGWCELIARPSLRPFPFVPWAFKGDSHIL